MTTHAPVPTVRRSAAGLLAALLAGLATAASRRPPRPAAWLMALLLAGSASLATAQNPAVTFTLQPVASTAVEGHPIAFLVRDDLQQEGNLPSYQWYRNDAAIPGAIARYYHFSAQLDDHGARYHVVAQGRRTKGDNAPAGPTASSQATLTVLPAGSALPPALTAPAGDTVFLTTDYATCYTEFRALGNDLQWSYRFDAEPPDSWHVLSADWNGAQVAQIDVTPPAGGTSITVRVSDDASVSATRTWALVPNRAPTIVLQPTATPNPVAWPGPTTLSVTATDADGDPLTYTWRKIECVGNLWPVTFVPNGTTASATTSAGPFAKFGTNTIQVTVSDGRGGVTSRNVSVTVGPHYDMRADVNADGVVNAFDLGIIVDNFGSATP